MQLLVEFACEVASLVLEVGMLVHVVCAKFLDFSNVKAGLFVVWFRLITTTMILQYLFVRITQSLTLFREAIAAVPVLNGLAPLLERIVSTAIGARGKLDELRSSLLSKRASPAISTKKQQQKKKKSKKGVSSKYRTSAVGKSGDPKSGTSEATSSSSEISSDQEFVQEHSSEVDDSTDKLEEPAKEALKAGDTSTSTNQTRSPDSSHGSKAGGNLANTTAAGKSKKRETKNKKRNE
jgi:hypothetical protein